MAGKKAASSDSVCRGVRDAIALGSGGGRDAAEDLVAFEDDENEDGEENWTEAYVVIYEEAGVLVFPSQEAAEEQRDLIMVIEVRNDATALTHRRSTAPL